MHEPDTATLHITIDSAEPFTRTVDVLSMKREKNKKNYTTLSNALAVSVSAKEKSNGGGGGLDTRSIVSASSSFSSSSASSYSPQPSQPSPDKEEKLAKMIVLHIDPSAHLSGRSQITIQATDASGDRILGEQASFQTTS